jgi:hypothetical protein
MPAIATAITNSRFFAFFICVQIRQTLPGLLAGLAVYQPPYLGK